LNLRPAFAKARLAKLPDGLGSIVEQRFAFRDFESLLAPIPFLGGVTG
jgi:hypothetical protein